MHTYKSIVSSNHIAYIIYKFKSKNDLQFYLIQVLRKYKYVHYLKKEYNLC